MNSLVLEFDKFIGGGFRRRVMFIVMGFVTVIIKNHFDESSYVFFKCIIAWNDIEYASIYNNFSFKNC